MYVYIYVCDAQTVQKVSATNKGSVVFDELPPKTSQNSSASARSKIDDVNKTKPSTLKKVLIM